MWFAPVAVQHDHQWQFVSGVVAGTGRRPCTRLRGGGRRSRTCQSTTVRKGEYASGGLGDRARAVELVQHAPARQDAAGDQLCSGPARRRPAPPPGRAPSVSTRRRVQSRPPGASARPATTGGPVRSVISCPSPPVTSPPTAPGARLAPLPRAPGVMTTSPGDIDQPRGGTGPRPRRPGRRSRRSPPPRNTAMVTQAATPSRVWVAQHGRRELDPADRRGHAGHRRRPARAG